jgi:hypothetical protein
MKCTVLRAERGKTNPMKYIEAVTARATLHESHTQLATTNTRMKHQQVSPALAGSHYHVDGCFIRCTTRSKKLNKQAV